MGSGKGKSKRLSASASAPATPVQLPEVVVDYEQWSVFVDDQGLGKVRLSEYYDCDLADTPRASPGSGTRQAEVARELLHDFVASGAITLPAGVEADEFDFFVCDLRYSEPNDYEIESLMVKDSKSQAEIRCCPYPSAVLQADTTLGGDDVKDLSWWIGSAVRRALLSRAIIGKQ